MRARSARSAKDTSSVPKHSSTQKLQAALPKGFNPAEPLRPVSRELFAQGVVAGLHVQIAYERAGYSGTIQSRQHLRNQPEVDARIVWLLKDRVRVDTKRRHRSEKKPVSLKERALEELGRVAFSDVRDIVQWERVAIVDADGTVTGWRNVMTVTPSDKLTAAQAATIREVSTKSGELKFATHDKMTALDRLCRALGIFSDPAPVPHSLVVQQFNGSDVKALELARRLAFILAVTAAQQPQGQLIEGEKVEPTK